MNKFSTENTSLHEDYKPLLGDAISTSSDSHENVGVTQPKSYGLAQDFKQLLGNAISMSSDSCKENKLFNKLVAMTSIASDKTLQKINMNKTIFKNTSLHEDYKPLLGDAISTSSDSHENVEVTQPNSYSLAQDLKPLLDNAISMSCDSCTNNLVYQGQVGILNKDNILDSQGNKDKKNWKNMKLGDIPQDLIESLGSMYEKMYGATCAGFNTYLRSSQESRLFVCFLSRRLLFKCDKNEYSKYVAQYRDHNALKKKEVDVGNNHVLVIFEKSLCFRKQAGLWDTVSSAANFLAQPFVMLNTARDLYDRVMSREMKLLIIDLIVLVVNIKDGYLTVGKFAGILLSVYNLHVRYTTLFSGLERNYQMQTGASITDILLGFSTLGMPAKVLEAIKNFTTITGKRIFDSGIVMEVMAQFFDALIVIINWIANPYGDLRLLSESNERELIKLVKKIGGSFAVYKDITSVCEIYTRYVSNPQTIFDPTFRAEIMKKYDKCKGDPYFLEYVSHPNNRFFSTTWKLFEDNIVKSCRAFDETRREEPICIVLEGAAGSGKSTLMNNFVDLLRKAGYTTISHSVPASEDGKDFYDDYENQQVFVMDDVGQQGKSQWRYIINYVSPVKYPLPCAVASKKNTKFFNSKVVLCTTNHFRTLGGFTSSDCISEPSALFRRPHVIQVDRAQTPTFQQTLTYYKYDHLSSNVWENSFLHHCSTTTLPVTQTGDNTDSLRYLYRVFKHIEACDERDREATIVTEADLQSILDEEGDMFYETQSFSIMDYIPLRYINKIFDMIEYVKEFVAYHTFGLIEYIERTLFSMKEFFGDVWSKRDFSYAKVGVGILGGILGIAVIRLVMNMFDREVAEIDISFSKQNVSSEIREHDVFGPQSAVEGVKHQYDEWISMVKKNCKTLIVKQSDGLDEHTQCVVSGKRILLPSHLDIGKKFVDLYATWEHFKNKHVEIENVQLRKVKEYISCDLAVYEIIGTVPLYKLCKCLFNGKATGNSNWFLINSSGHLPVRYDVDVKRNDHCVTYSSYNNKYNHRENSGFLTPYSVSGGCGTVLATPGAGVLGFHVAGSPSTGFCVQPPEVVADEIKSLMLEGESALGFETDDKIIPNFSGVRLRYEEPVDLSRANGSTVYEPSLLHVSACEEMSDLIMSIKRDPLLTTVCDKEIGYKAPPNFRSGGTPAETLKKLSQKTFMRQGRVTQEEIDFIKSYLRTLMIKFGDLPDEVVAFGSSEVAAINKDSSNGYGCMRGKDRYFDFPKKEIKQAMRDLIDRVSTNAKKGVYDYNDFLCKETFKDELRKQNKIDTPRTFRVMPLGHIWWTKKIFGSLLYHFKEHRNDTGVAVGYNPYIDADVLAKKLLMCPVTGDADFGKWDGTVLGIFLRSIFEVFREFYVGEHEYMIEWLCNTISQSFVLVNDEMYATTHGLPSGTWLTLLLNCLVNKSLTALVIFRNKPYPRVEDVSEVVDFVMGDDKIFGVSEEMSKYYNLFTVKQVSESLGMDCTNGDKTAITQKSQPFEKLTFVKRHFRQHPVLRRYVGCLSLDTIMNTLQWCRRDTEDPHEAMCGKMRAMQVEAYIHSPILFSRLTCIFNKYYPYDSFFDEKKICDILAKEEGYERILNMQDKFFM